jgi:hypothetical protein
VACTSEAANGNDVACWFDQSGNGLAYTQSTSGFRPNFVTNIQNGQPVLQFNGSSDRLNSAAVLAAGDDTFTYFGAWSAFVNNQFQILFEQNHNTVLTGRRAGFILTNGGRIGFNGQSNDFHNGPTFSTNQFYITDILLNGAGSNNVAVYQDGTSLVGTINMTTQDVSAAGGSAVGYKIPSNNEFFNGQAAEIIVFSDTLNDVERLLVENYMNAKYDRPLATDVYDGDTVGNDHFDLDMAGIGQLGGNEHVQAHSAGIIVRDVDFLQDDGDWLTFGHHDEAPGYTADDLPPDGDWAGATNGQRWVRHWYFDRTDAGTMGGTVDIIFDLSEGSMNACCLPSGPTSNYRLLGRSLDSGDFEDITAASGAVVVYSGDQIMFLGVDVTELGSNFTVGTLDEVNSPTAITLLNSTANGRLPVDMVLVTAVLLFGMLTLVVYGRGRQSL